MTVFKFIKYMTVTTILAVGYIHLQMETIDLAYQGKKKEREIRRLIEENGYMTYDVLTMKSASHLGERILAENSPMQFVDQSNIIKVSYRVPGELDTKQLASASETNRPFLSFFNIGTPAEAKTKE